MTYEELEEQWTRYMHRNDLQGDYETTYLFASSMTLNRMMAADITIDEIMEFEPSIMLHAGLAYLSDLAQDNDGLGREQNYFEQAASDYQMRRSIVNTTAPAAK